MLREKWWRMRGGYCECLTKTSIWLAFSLTHWNEVLTTKIAKEIRVNVMRPLTSSQHTERLSTFKCSIGFLLTPSSLSWMELIAKCQADNPYPYSICNFGLHSINEFCSASSSVWLVCICSYATVVKTVHQIGFCFNKIGLFHLNNLTASQTDADDCMSMNNTHNT